MNHLAPRFLEPNHPAISRSPSSTSASDEAETEGNEEESAEDDSDMDLILSESTTIHLNPALATPKSTTQSSWPYTSTTQSSPSITIFTPIKIPASSLPHEILLSILKLLPSSSLSPALLVCKSWCQCGVELLWHKPAFGNLSSLFRMLFVISASSQSEELSVEEREGGLDDEDEEMETSNSEVVQGGTTFPYPTFIKRLNFSTLSEEMSDKILNKLTACVYLERLTLASCSAISSFALINMVRVCDRLVALDLSDVVGTEDSVLLQVAKSCTKLQGLNLSGCIKVTDLGVEAIARGCPGLRRIKLRSVCLITDNSIVLLSLLCPLLLEVDLVTCPLITSVSLYQLFQTSHHLRELSLAACGEINDEAFPGGVESINGSEVIETGDRMVMTTNGTELKLPLPLKFLSNNKTFDHLRYLDLTSLSLITDDAIKGIVKFMPRIRNLILAKCIGLTDEAVISICSLGKHLHYLHMGHVGGITDRAVTRLARSCTRLRYIDLACCNLLTDMSVFELATNLPRLKRIGLVRVTNLTDQAIYALFARPSLERIHLSYCENVTVQAIHDLLQHLPRLTHLSLTGVPAFRRTDLQTWCRTPPRDFNTHQRQSFCVYSGKGVQELRRYLRSISAPPPITPLEESSDPSTTTVPASTTTPATRTTRAVNTRNRDRNNELQVIPPHNPITGRHIQAIPNRVNTRSNSAISNPGIENSNESTNGSVVTERNGNNASIPIRFIDPSMNTENNVAAWAQTQIPSNSSQRQNGSNHSQGLNNGNGNGWEEAVSRNRAETITRGNFIEQVIEVDMEDVESPGSNGSNGDEMRD